MEIAKFKTTDAAKGNLEGFLLGYPHTIRIERQEDGGQLATEGKRKPTFRFYVREGNVEIQVGAAWEEKSKKAKGVYYSVELNNLGPTFSRKIVGNLVPSMKDPGTMSLLWDSPQDKAEYAAKKAALQQQPALASA